MDAGLEGIDASDVSFLPIVATYARELGVVEEINRLCGRTKGVNAGQVCADSNESVEQSGNNRGICFS
jgi:hypothetical protein